jgi:RNA polymerase sigma factor (TIGR02999 family)
MSTPRNITSLLQAWERGEQAALEELMPMVMAELRRLAKRYLRRERPGHTLQTTALINEAFIKLAGQDRIHWHNRSHFYGIAAQCMRRVLIDYAKMQHRLKRGGVSQPFRLSEAPVISEHKSAELIALDAALIELARIDERKSRVVEMKYFGGYTVQEISESLNLSAATVARDWRMARAWLQREIGKV